MPINSECYEYKSYRDFARVSGGGDNVRFVKAGVGGTPSELGMIRFERDVLRDGRETPDIVVVEFAVNDDGDETKGNCYESLVRKILTLPNRPVVVLSKNQYFYDMFHPTNAGHTVMADCLTYFFTNAAEQESTAEPDSLEKDLPEPVIGADFERVWLLDRKDMPEFPYNWMYCGQKAENEGQPFTLELSCRAILLIFKDSGETKAGRAEMFVDGERKLVADPHINGWLHCNPVILLQEKETKRHEIRIRMAAGDEEKEFTILGFGYV